MKHDEQNRSLVTQRAPRHKLQMRATIFGFVACTISSLALTAENPYTGIVGRNAFALKPPTPLTVTPISPVVQPPSIELQGITTILGRPQVLLRIKLAARPPEPAKEQSVVLDVGQREGEVEVLEIDAVAGSVLLKNQGANLPLNMQDNAAKPQVVASFPPTTTGIGGIPAPAKAVLPTAGANVTTLGGGTGRSAVNSPSTGVGALPTRSLRAAANDVQSLPPDAQVALIEVERERTKDAVQSGKMPPMPPITLPQR